MTASQQEATIAFATRQSSRQAAKKQGDDEKNANLSNTILSKI
jgi:hypothetical protein